MPPKKKSPPTTTMETNEPSETKFAWTAENDRLLLILCFGWNPTTEDYARIVAALPAGASYNGVKIRCSKMRVEMKKRYAELGWAVPEGAAAAKAKAKPEGMVKGGKRKGCNEEGDADAQLADEDAAEDAAEDEKDTRVKKGVKRQRVAKGEGNKGEKGKKAVKQEEIEDEDVDLEGAGASIGGGEGQEDAVQADNENETENENEDMV